jgi:RHS repeat-associated protein
MKTFIRLRSQSLRAAAVLAAASITTGFSATASGAVGATAGTFGVSQIGAAQYSISLFAPPGAGGLKPGISLVYSSTTSDDLAGAGFGISGLSRISRCNKTLAANGTYGAPTLSISDQFCLDGNILRLTSGSYGAPGSRYQTEIESFTRVTAYDVAGNGPAYFIAELKNGLIYEYGNSSDSRVESLAAAGGQVATPRVWALNRIRDRSGNSIDFTYLEDTTHGAFRPDRITWTGNASQGLRAPYQMAFVYETAPRPDTLYGYRFGTQTTVNGEITETHRLDRIDVLYNDAVVRRYELSYEPSGGAGARSRLQSIQECGVGGTDCYSPTTFSWVNGTPSWNSESSAGQPVPALPFIVDINGDGRDDLVYSSTVTSGSGTWTYMLASSSGYGTPISTGYANTNFSDAQPIEWDGDGRADLLIPYQGSTWWVLRANGNGFDPPVNTGAAWSATSAGNQWWVADIDGDGRTDLIRIDGGVNVYARLRSGSAFGAEILIASLQLGSGGSTLRANAFGTGTRQRSAVKHPDFDGDGREDFVIKITGSDEPDFPNPIRSTVYLCVVLSRSSATAENYCLPAAAGTITTVGPQDWFMGDANADGLTDLFWLSSGGAYVAKSRGMSAEGVGPVNVSTYTAASAVAADWDGDGRDDLILSNSSTGMRWVSRSDGVALSAPISTGVSSGVGNFHSVGDIDGDGLPDLMRAAPAWVYSTHLGVPADLLDQAVDGFGNFINFDYASISQSHYLKGTTDLGVTGPVVPATTYPHQDYSGPMQVVSQYSASNGIGGSYTMSYQYYGATLDLSGRGFEGFYAVAFSDSRSGLHAYRFFRRDFPFTGRLLEEDLYQPDNATLISRQAHTLLSATLDSTATNQRLFPYVSRSVALAQELNGAPVTQATISYTFGDGFTYGNPTQVIATTTDRDASSPFVGQAFTQTTTLHFDYASASTYWCIGRPDQIAIQNTLPDTTSETRTRGTPGAGIDYANCRVATAYVEPSSPTLAVTTNYEFDSTGNVRSVQVAGRNWDGSALAPRATTASFGGARIFPEAVTNALGQSAALTYRYDLGLPATQTDANGLTVSWIYDAFGRKTRETRADGTYTTFDISACNSGNAYCNTSDALARMSVVSTAMDSLGVQVRQDQVVYDAFGRTRYEKTQLATGAMSTVATTYDARGRLATKSSPYTCCTTYSTTYSYDLLDRLVQTSTPITGNGGTQVVSYAHQGRTLSITDARGTTQNVTDVMGQLRRIVDPTPAGITQYSYDPFGNLVSTTDAAGATQSWTYNRLGFKTGASVPVIDAGTWSYRLNSLGELISQTNARGQTVTYTYDALSRPLSRTEPEGTTQWIWDTALGRGIGQLAAVSSPGYGESYVYDTLGRPKIVSYAEDRTYQVDYTYNAQGLLDTLTYPVSNANYRLKVKHDYSYGVLTATRDAAGSTVFWQLNAVDAFSHPIDEQMGNGLRVISSFDPSTGWMESRQSGSGGSTGNVQHLAYEWDTNGNLIQRRDLNRSLTESFHYDTLHRLTDSALNGSPNFSVSLDAAGNILSKSGVAYTYDATFRRALLAAGGNTYSYDSNGNMTSRAGGSVSWTSYDLPSSISSAGLVSQFFYGADRQRWKQVATFADGPQTTIYVGGLMEKVRTPSGTGYRHYISAGSSTVVYTRWCDGTTNTFYAVNDHLGSSSTVTCGADVGGCGNGAIFVEESFDPYGARRGSDWTGVPSIADRARFGQTTRHGYTGHEMLDNIGLIHMNGRVYDPSIGRFLSADPFMTTGSQGLNRYSYVLNNPLSLIDPSGFKPLLKKDDRTTLPDGSTPVPSTDGGSDGIPWNGGGGYWKQECKACPQADHSWSSIPQDSGAWVASQIEQTRRRSQGSGPRSGTRPRQIDSCPNGDCHPARAYAPPRPGFWDAHGFVWNTLGMGAWDCFLNSGTPFACSPGKFAREGTIYAAGVLPFSRVLGGATRSVTAFAGHGVELAMAGSTVVPEGVAITLPRAGAAIPDRLGQLMEAGNWEAIVANPRYAAVMEGATTYLPGATVPNLILLPPTGLVTLPNSVRVSTETLLSDLLKTAEGPCVWAACRVTP